MNQNPFEFTRLLASEETIDKRVYHLSNEKRSVLSELVKMYYEDEQNTSDLDIILEYDDYLTELLVDKTAYVNIVESELLDDPVKVLNAKDAPFSKSEVEQAYLSLADTLFELSKLINPLGGFGKDRLEAGISIIRGFEKRFWPVATRITKDNVVAFKELIPSEHYDDIRIGRKRAIGALRIVGEVSCAAGVAVYTVPLEDDEDPMIRLDWLMVHEDLRESGIGNFLIAQILELTFQHEGMGIYVDLPVKRFEDDYEADELSVLYNCMDSWNILFDMTVGNLFSLKISDCRGNEMVDQRARNVISLREVMEKMPVMAERFLEGVRADQGKLIGSLPMEFFDKDISCAVFCGRKIRAMLLFHRLEDDSIRYEGLLRDEDSDEPDALNLIRFAYEACREKGIEDNFVFGALWSEEGMEFLGKIIPKVQINMLYRGVLLPEEINLSSMDWDMIRKEAGLSDEMIPNTGIRDENLGPEEESLIRNCFEESLY
jgi:hypothetical protein